MRSYLRLVYGAVLLVIVGCNFEAATTIDHKMTLKGREVKSFVATATARTQKLVVLVKSGQKVDVGIVLEEDANEAKEAMKTGKEPPKNFEFFADTDDAALKFVTHPNKGFAVIIRNPSDESTNVHLTVKPQ